MLGTTVRSGSWVWLFTPARDAAKTHLGSICPFVVIDPTDSVAPPTALMRIPSRRMVPAHPDVLDRRGPGGCFDGRDGLQRVSSSQTLVRLRISKSRKPIQIDWRGMPFGPARRGSCGRAAGPWERCATRVAWAAQRRVSSYRPTRQDSEASCRGSASMALPWRRSLFAP